MFYSLVDLLIISLDVLYYNRLMCYIIIDCWWLPLSIPVVSSSLSQDVDRLLFFFPNLILLNKPYIYLFVPHIYLPIFYVYNFYVKLFYIAILELL